MATHETALKPRSFLHSARFRAEHPSARAFLAPRKERVAKVQHPKPFCGMCGGKIHTRTDYRAPDEGRGFPYSYSRRGDADAGAGWWLCPSCDIGPEVGLARAA